METLKQIIAQYEKNKLDLKNVIGTLEMKINEFKNLINERKNQIDEENSAKKSKLNILSGFFQKDKEGKVKKDKDKKEKKDRKSEN